MVDINGGELLIIALLAVVLIGPERLPQYAAQLARLVRRAKAFMADAKERVADELGPEVSDVDWSKLDPRQYDPRRIVRDALLDDGPLLPGLGGAASARAATHASTPATQSATHPATAARSAAEAAPASPAGSTVRGAAAGAAPGTSGAPFDPDAT
ncbi:Sec-independent protein translocase TatB [Xylanimonas ulmi]|uniref:Sec-independent protein translocase protein TatB n=1 Tax=Xylanimonas ulmi TaxID=228973 RepID=A0A4Q7M4A8_9MICO|nr:Sec-independent protein translocase TatB [Xylanibacterium ulmi]RZS61747.1 sec-independent protein translocase protein TatB [Xylanibacterium ulmi]